MKKTKTVALGLACALTLSIGAFGMTACSKDECPDPSAHEPGVKNECPDPSAHQPTTPPPAPTLYTVSYETNGGNEIAETKVEEGTKATAPETPVRSGYYEFAGWYTDASLTVPYQFSADVTGNLKLYAKWEKKIAIPEDEPVTGFVYGDEIIGLNENALYVNLNLKDSQLGKYSFNSLEKCAEAAVSGTKEQMTYIYLEPDVYWTDDYTKTEVRESNDLVGLTLAQDYIYMVGLSDNREDVVIASDRGQNQGANGNFNTIAVGSGFHAKNVTFGNYCNVDLVYPRDTSKNHAKRSDAIVQAQTVTSTTWNGTADERYYENCAFVSRLNCYVANTNRELFVNCHFEMTDDSLGGGKIQIYTNCDFDNYSGTPNPCAEKLQAFLGCTFNTKMNGDEAYMALSKGKPNCAFIDCDFIGENLKGVNWCKSYTYNDIRNVVYNTNLNGNPLEFDKEEYPYIQYTLTAEQLKAFKVGEEYNVYNLVNTAGFDEWDPLNQKEAMKDCVLPWGLMLSGSKNGIVGDGEDSLEVTFNTLGLATGATFDCAVDDNDAATLTVDNENGKVVIKGSNSDYKVHTVCLTVTTDGGIKKAFYFNVNTTKADETAPTASDVAITGIENGTVNVTYTLSDNPAAAVGQEEFNPDRTVVDWFRSTDGTLDGAKHVATTRYLTEGASAYTDYRLSKGDIGYYLIAVITPKYAFSEYSQQEYSAVTARAITEADLTAEQKRTYYTDFSTVVLETPEYTVTNDTSEETPTDKFKNTVWGTMQSGTWYGGVQKPDEYALANKDTYGNSWSSKSFSILGNDGNPNANAWVYGTGQDGMKDKYGMLVNQRGARMVYADDSEVGDMTFRTTLAIGKTASQGFGSGYQFFETYFKYDVNTRTGYGLRISRGGNNNGEDWGVYNDFLSSACVFELMKYENGVATRLGDWKFSSCFLTDCTVEFKMEGNKLTCNVTTTKEQNSTKYTKLENGMPHSVSFEYTETGEVNKFGGFGFQHTGTTGGNALIVRNVEAIYGTENS